ncbi:MAG TPA: ABC transporter substrate-binding protein [Candidatus Binatia bacterium]
MKAIRKQMGVLAAGFCAFLLYAGIVYGGEQQVKKFRLLHDGLSAATAVVWVGVDAGFFKQNGLELNEVFLQDPSKGGVQALLGVDLFLGSGNPLVPLYTMLEGGDLVFLGSHTSREEYRFGLSSEVKSIVGLKGRKIGMSGLGGRSDLIARVVLRRAGINPVSEVEMVSVGFSPARAAALSQNLIQGAPLSPQVASEAERLGVKVIEVSEVPVVTALLITTRSIVKKDEDVFKRFMKAYVEATHYFLTHREESLRIMEKRVSAPTSEVLESMYGSLAAQMAPWPAPNAEAVQAIIDAAAAVEKGAGKLKPENLFDLKFLQELKDSGFIDGLYTKKVKL